MPTMNLKRIIATIVTLLVALMILGLSVMILNNVRTMTGQEEDVLEKEPQTIESPNRDSTSSIKEVKVMEIKNRKMETGFSVQGRLRAYDKTDLVAEVPGLMKPMSKRFKIGTRYNKDEVVFEVDDAEARLALKAKRAQLHTAITKMLPDMKIDMPSSYANWKSYWDRLDPERSIFPLPKPLSDREEYYVSLQGLHSQYYDIKSQEVRLTKYRVLAPFDGIITSVLIGESGYLRAGVSLGTIMNTSEYELEAAVPVSDLKSVRQGRKVKVVSDDTGKSWMGKINRIGDLIDPNTQTATVYITLQGAGLREGQYLRAILEGNTGRAVTTIPNHLLIERNKVLVVEDDWVKLKSVQLIKTEGGEAWISGLPDRTFMALDNVDPSDVGTKVIPVK